ncbi:MAG: D-hexose-6-phosphate mutarotase [Alphaproteobacteria bacterium]|nr:D-hexose-6-phosphate mutarotase [Alphaproteobacteria bacterium]MCB9690617.1 D-hexose-6-phosphate mutarotase [Alphaproteobacteria bacterium]
MIELSHPGGLSASIDLHGATVTSFRALGREILFVSPNAVRRAGKAIRGGIPVCWPWFAGHPDHPELPAHGVARDRPWTLAGMGHEGGAHVARLTLVDDDATREVWPHAFHLELVVRLGSRLTVELLHTNVDDVPLQVGGALHTYLRVADLGSARVHGLDGLSGFDKVAGVPFVQDGPVEIRGEHDRIYGDAPAHLALEHAGGSVDLENVAPDAVIWNPGAEKAASMGDLGPGNHAGFVCVEAAATRLCTLAPGETFRLATTLGVRA